MAKPKQHPSATKARKMLRDGKVHGKNLTAKQRRYFGLIAGGGSPSRVKRKK